MRTRLLVPVLALLLAAPLAGCTWWDGFQNRRTGPGDLALDYIQGDRKVVIDLRYVDGAGPNAEALADFKAEVQGLLGKTVEIRQSGGVPGKGSSHRYTWGEIEDLERAHRSLYTNEDHAVISMLYLDGGSEGDRNDGRILGAAYHGSSTVIFKGNVRSSSAENPGLINIENKPAQRHVERAVLVHEIGHILGLVNHGLPMTRNHEMTDDPVPETSANEGKGHSANRQSVMYWAVESSALVNLFFLNNQAIPYQFDADDKADVAAAR